ncbi:MAG TPA: PIN domain-containing protein [Pyrinomonadaceae bacterium]|nr:PIN domain-containing protein [Pyrinomonadaceae bacterium]
MPSRDERLPVVLDTNVVVGFFTSRTRHSHNARVFNAWLVLRRLQLIVSPPLTHEYLELLARIDVKPDQIMRFQQRLLTCESQRLL